MAASTPPGVGNPHAPVGPPAAPESAPSGDWRDEVPRHGLPLPELEKDATQKEEEAAAVEEPDFEARYPDAWSASFGTAVSRALARRNKESGKMVAELVFGADDRIRIQNVDRVPYRWVCSLIITAANGSLWLGTGWLASPRVVITAGHCVYLHNQGGWAKKVLVCPARNGNNRPFVFTSTQPRSVEGWVVSRLPESDYGALLLNSNDGNHGLGYMGYGALADEELFGLLANVTGYPSDKDAGTLWGHTRSLMTVRPETLSYDIDTYGGMSGSPVLRWDGSDYVVVGIHNYGDLAGNQATRVTPEVFETIEFWKSQAP